MGFPVGSEGVAAEVVVGGLKALPFPLQLGLASSGCG
jgi:hypothetical protein